MGWGGWTAGARRELSGASDDQDEGVGREEAWAIIAPVSTPIGICHAKP